MCIRDRYSLFCFLRSSWFNFIQRQLAMFMTQVVSFSGFYYLLFVDCFGYFHDPLFDQRDYLTLCFQCSLTSSVFFFISILGFLFFLSSVIKFILLWHEYRYYGLSFLILFSIILWLHESMLKWVYYLLPIHHLNCPFLSVVVGSIGSFIILWPISITETLLIAHNMSASLRSILSWLRFVRCLNFYCLMAINEICRFRFLQLGSLHVRDYDIACNFRCSFIGLLISIVFLFWYFETLVFLFGYLWIY